MLLSELKTGQSAVILRVLGHGGFRKRIMEMGFVRGKLVKVLLNAPLKDPIKYQVMDYEVSLRRSEAAMIEVITEQEAVAMPPDGHDFDVVEHPSVEHIVHRSQNTIDIALVGNPNSGKTSLFNAASGAHEHVGNYGGVTVDAGGRVIGFTARGAGGVGMINAGCCLVRRDVIEKEFTGYPERFSLEADWLPGLAARGGLGVSIQDAPFIDIGVPEDYARFCESCAERR